jgi:hypothetical protein
LAVSLVTSNLYTLAANRYSTADLATQSSLLKQRPEGTRVTAEVEIISAALGECSLFFVLREQRQGVVKVQGRTPFYGIRFLINSLSLARSLARALSPSLSQHVAITHKSSQCMHM